MEIQQRQREIGAFFRDYRLRAGVSLREAAGPVMSAAKLSRFERGATNISADTALALMHRLGMQLSEFVRLAAESAYALPTNSAAIWLQDWPRVRRANAAYVAAHAGDPQTWLQDIVALLVKTQAEPLGSAMQLSVQEERRLSAFLAYPHHWRRVEMSLIEACAPLASSEFRQECWARLALAFGATDHQVERLAIRQALLTAAVKFGEWAAFEAGLPELVKVLDTPALRPLLNDRVTAAALLKQIGRWHAAGQPATWPAIDDLLAAVNAVAAPGFAQSLQALWDCAQQPRPAHHHRAPGQAAAAKSANAPTTAPTAAAAEPTAQPFSGPAMAALRERRQVTLRDASIAWAPSTQLRFERGETQLGIARLDLLKDFLLSSWRDLISGHYNFHVNLVAHYRSQVGAYYHAGKLTEESAHALADEFAARASDLAEPVRNLQRFEVLAYAYTGVAAPLPPADLAAIQDLLKKAPGWNGDLCLLFADVAKALPAAFDYHLWRSLYVLDQAPKLQVANPFNVDFTVAVSIAHAGDAALARAMQSDLAVLAAWPLLQCPNDWSLSAHLASLVCQWVQTPTAEAKAAIERHVQAMVTLGYTALAADAQESLAAVVK
ncbi:helix-turn-helix domain-containing protein [Lacticaseibacillus jixianensis]|uniref:Helix-turn-helix domain-containing protein n=1 Tax=Lacticaseibacillus jixianensis TaxID=2486012 RepID=A0ABW4BC37_9LACO|nr:helix-turn-helix transcriptional regulator [Lacticaseibacillus jixianensis]